MKTELITLMLLTTACASKIDKIQRDVKYSAYEMVGMEKRDLFKSEVKKVKSAQEDSGEEFEDALKVLKRVYAFDGGKLEDQYDDLNSSYEGSANSVKEVKASIKRLETVAGDLFVEWREELRSIKTPALRQKSEEKLKATEKRFGTLKRQLHKAEVKMDPVLEKLHDQVLFIKHNLNAEAIGSLKTEGDKIKVEIDQLLIEMKKSATEADQLIETL